MRPSALACATSLPFFVRYRLGPMLLTMVLACILGASPLSACVRKNKAAGAWVTVTGNDVMIKIRGFTAFNPPGGSATCGCGLQHVPSLASLTSAEVRREDNGQKIEAFDFKPDNGVGSVFSGLDNNSPPWFGFSTSLSQAPDTPADLVFYGKLASGANFDSLKSELEAAGDNMGLGEVNPKGGLIICPIGVIDQLSSAPSVRVSRMALENPHFVELRVLDAEEGLKTVQVVEDANLLETVPAFTPGTTLPVDLRFTMAEGKATAAIGIEACNIRGECSSWRGKIVDLKAGKDGRSSRDLTDVPSTSRFIKLQNGNPGVSMFVLNAKGKRFSVRPLADGQFLNINAALAVDGPKNDIQLAGVGGPESEVMVLIVDALGEE